MNNIDGKNKIKMKNMISLAILLKIYGIFIWYLQLHNSKISV